MVEHNGWGNKPISFGVDMMMYGLYFSDNRAMVFQYVVSLCKPQAPKTKWFIAGTAVQVMVE